MNQTQLEHSLEKLFLKAAGSSRNPRSVCLLVHSPRQGLNMQWATGFSNGEPAHPQQPNYMASCGKLFTATLVAMLVEQGQLSFTDPIARYLGPELMQGLHVFKGNEYSADIQISHLLGQTSGLPDHFWPLVKQMQKDKQFNMSPREAIEWAKRNMKPKFPPGERFHYTDINYHLLGLIIEQVTGEPFHASLHGRIFEPVGMRHSWMLHHSEPAEPSPNDLGGFYHDNLRWNEHVGFAGLDYAGGGVVATTSDLLIFMKAVVNYELVSADTLALMMTDTRRSMPIFDYGYGIWQFRTIPLIAPKRIRSWGVFGASGAYMVYHPGLDTYAIGTLNDTTYMRKGVTFVMKLMNTIWKAAQ